MPFEYKPVEYDNYDMDEYGNLDFTEPSKDETRSTITQPQITRHGHLHTGQLSCHFFLTSDQLGTQITPRGWIFWTMIFYNLKNSHQDLSNEGSNFILSSLEVGH